MMTIVELPTPDGDTADAGRSHRRLLFLGLAVIYVIAAVLAIQHQLQGPSWDPALEPYVAFVESERGLSFHRPVDVRWADISSELADDFAAEREAAPTDLSPDPFQEAYGLLGLVDVDPSVSFAESVQDTATAQAGAFYDPVVKTIVLPAEVDPHALGFTIVHELVHALQHQHGMLGGRAESADAARTRTALIEGDAERVAVAWFDQLDAAARDSYFEAIDSRDTFEEFDDRANTFLETSFSASYVLGLPAVQAIVESGGQDEIDRLLRSKTPGSSERLIDVLSPSPFSEADASGLMRLPGGVEAVDGDLGAVVWFQALAPQIGTRAAIDSLVGYDDDAFVMFDEGNQRCARFLVTFDSADDAEQFATQVEPVTASAQGELRTVSPKSIEMTTCAPLGNPDDQRFGTIMPLVVANEVTLMHLRSGARPEAARCAALAQATSIPADEPLSSFVGWGRVEELAPPFLEECQPAVFSPR